MAYLRFHRRIALGRYLRLNLGKRSVSLTAGRRRGGPHVTASTNGTVTSSIGLPGTGASIVHRGKMRRVLDWLHIHPAKPRTPKAVPPPPPTPRPTDPFGRST